MPIIGDSISDAYEKYKNNTDPVLKEKVSKLQRDGKEILIFKKEPEGFDRLKASFGQAVKPKWAVGTFNANCDRNYKIKVCEDLIHGIADDADSGLVKIKEKAQEILNELRQKSDEIREIRSIN